MKKHQSISVKIFFLFAFMIISITQSLNSATWHVSEERIDSATKEMYTGSYSAIEALFQEGSLLYPTEPDSCTYVIVSGLKNKERSRFEKEITILMNRSNATELLYVLLGGYKYWIGKRKAAEVVYKKGLKRFSNSGILHSCLALVYLKDGDQLGALNYFEMGLEACPNYPANYFWSGKLYCHSPEPVWGMIYGELFMNLCQNEKALTEMSQLLYDTYTNQIELTGNGAKANFSASLRSRLQGKNISTRIRFPYGTAVYEPLVVISISGEQCLNLASLSVMRCNFARSYADRGYHKKYPNELYKYQKVILDAGHMEAYNYWLLGKANPQDFTEWLSTHATEWNEFIIWRERNGLKIDNDHKFYRRQYATIP